MIELNSRGLEFIRQEMKGKGFGLLRKAEKMVTELRPQQDQFLTEYHQAASITFSNLASYYQK